MSTVYRFRVDGELPEDGRETFCDMLVVEVPPGLVLYGAVIDESHLHGILAQFRTLGLAVVSAQPVDR